MRFKVFGQREAEQEELVRPHIDCPYVWISIRDSETPGGDNSLPKIYEHSEFWLDTLYLAFADFTTQECVDEVNKRLAEGGFPHRWRLFNTEDARRIFEFVTSYRDSAGLICCHCAAGIARSPAVARVLSLWLNGHDSDINYDHGVYPNSHVQAVLARYIKDKDNAAPFFRDEG